MPLPAIPLHQDDIVETVLFSKTTNQDGYIVMHWRVNNVVGAGALLTDVLGAIGTGVGPLITPRMSANAEFKGVFGNVIGPGPRSIQEFSSSGAAPGASGLITLPTQVSGIFQKLTTRAGRKFRGRGYVPFPSPAEQDPGTGEPIAAYIAAIGTLAGYLCTSHTVSPAGGQSVDILPVLLGKVRPATVAMTTDITGNFVPVKWATQRRRGDYGRPNV